MLNITKFLKIIRFMKKKKLTIILLVKIVLAYSSVGCVLVWIICDVIRTYPSIHSSKNEKKQKKEKHIPCCNEVNFEIGNHAR